MKREMRTPRQKVTTKQNIRLVATAQGQRLSMQGGKSR
jgi:hypothetical protein